MLACQNDQTKSGKPFDKNLKTETATMAVKVAIIGLGIMGQRMLTHMRRHQNFEPDYLWDPDESACHQALILDQQSKIMDSANDAISEADLVYLACPPAVREPYALAAAAAGKALFLEKPFGINLDDSAKLMAGLQPYSERFVPQAIPRHLDHRLTGKAA